MIHRDLLKVGEAKTRIMRSGRCIRQHARSENFIVDGAEIIVPMPIDETVECKKDPSLVDIRYSHPPVLDTAPVLDMLDLPSSEPYLFASDFFNYMHRHNIYVCYEYL